MSESANYIHLKRLFALRNIAIVFQILAILVVQFWLQIELPLKALSLIILQIILFNGFVWIRLNQPKEVSKNEIFIHLSIDVLALALLLYFTGGASNPFILLFLFPLTITVTILPVRYAWLLAALTVICYSLLMYNFQPLPMGHEMDHSGHGSHGMMQTESSEYNLHLVGMWLAFILNACLITYYVYGMGYTLRRQQKQLVEAREQSIRDEQLVILGTLAASTAHELGTPLATMSLLVEELGYENDDNNPRVTADLETLKSQINRCKKSLSDLSASVDASHDHFENEMLPVCEYIDYIVKEVAEVKPEASIKFGCDQLSQYWIKTDRTLTLALKNIIENATEVSPESVTILANVKVDQLQLEVMDEGPGLSAKAIANVGERPYSDKELGLGLGLYLAYSAIRRRQGSIEQSNKTDSKGSITTVRLPVFKDKN